MMLIIEMVREDGVVHRWNQRMQQEMKHHFLVMEGTQVLRVNGVTGLLEMEEQIQTALHVDVLFKRPPPNVEIVV